MSVISGPLSAALRSPLHVHGANRNSVWRMCRQARRRPSRAYHAALRERPAQNVDQLRAEAASRYEYLLAETMKDIAGPGPAFSAIGRLVTDEHGVPVPNRSVRNRAID